MTTDKSILEKVKKLLNLAEGAKEIGSLPEAENAMAQAQNLCMKYNLDMAEANKVDLNNEEAAENELDKIGRKEEGKNWESELCFGIAAANLCRGVVNRYFVTFIGTKANIELCTYMYNFIAPKLRKMSRASYNEHMAPIIKEYTVEARDFNEAYGMMCQYLGNSYLYYTDNESDIKQTKPNKDGLIKFHFHKEMKEHFDHIHVHTYIRTYLEGAVGGIQNRLMDEMYELRNGHRGDQVDALVQVHNSIAKKYMDEHFPDIGGFNPSSGCNTVATSRGYSDAKGMSLNKGIGAKAASQKQLK